VWPFKRKVPFRVMAVGLRQLVVGFIPGVLSRLERSSLALSEEQWWWLSVVLNMLGASAASQGVYGAVKDRRIAAALHFGMLEELSIMFQEPKIGEVARDAGGRPLPSEEQRAAITEGITDFLALSYRLGRVEEEHRAENTFARNSRLAEQVLNEAGVSEAVSKHVALDPLVVSQLALFRYHAAMGACQLLHKYRVVLDEQDRVPHLDADEPEDQPPRATG